MKPLIYDERIKTTIKVKGSINTPMAQLVEVVLEEESAIRSERHIYIYWVPLLEDNHF